MRFLSVEDVEFLHQLSIQEFGGTLGVRDRSGLESAVFHPQNVALYGRGDVFDIAAAYAYHIVQAQCFLDGNKRTAAAAALNFLANNGIEFRIEDERFYELMIGIADKRFTKDDIANYLRHCSREK
ncbi:MAG TPA: type II toxin-antitoxin system death-on-curing family toxin [Verrucomicrobiae bacterium]